MKINRALLFSYFFIQIFIQTKVQAEHTIDTPVLLLGFNRPEKLQKVFDQVKILQPKKLFIAVDGPRLRRTNEAERCKGCHAIAKQVNWPCELKTLFRDKNLGCGRAVSSAISWAFSHVDRLIILEDDCLPSISFFYFCQELLERYKDHEQIFSIGGYTDKQTEFKYSYIFEYYFRCWGWATWKRAWSKFNFDHSMDVLDLKKLERLYPTEKKTLHDMRWHLVDIKKRRLNFWANRYLNTILNNNGFTITSSKTLVQNIGCDYGTNRTNKKICQNRFEEFDYTNIIHPEAVVPQEAKLFRSISMRRRTRGRR